MAQTGNENGRWYYIDEDGRKVGNYRSQQEAESARRRAASSSSGSSIIDDDDDDC